MTHEITAAPRDPNDAGIELWHVVALLDAATTAVATELQALGDDLAQRRPAPGEWCANECVGHLIEADRRGFAGRIRRILTEEGVLEPDWDQAGVAAARRDQERPVVELLAEFAVERADAIALVRSLTEDDLSRSGVHAQVGRITVRDLLQEWVFHDRNHLRQLLACAQARAWPAMGNTRRFDHLDA